MLRILVVFLLSFTWFLSPRCHAQTLDGDMNHDGQLTVADLTLLANAILGKVTHEYVDLALPSGTLWATCNVGASAPEECGDYYVWSADIAREQWGEEWTMPTHEQMQELLNEDYCYVEPASVNGVAGYMVESVENGNWIFLPAAGYQQDDEVYQKGNLGYYWSGELNPDRATHAWIITFNLRFSQKSATSDGAVGYGHSVRPVRVKK